MTKFKGIFIALGLAVLLGSCASALKKQCKATNWFEHGKAVALSGRRLNSDDFVERCKKEDVEVDEGQVDLGFKAGMGQYCTPEGAKETGRKGDPFNGDLCNPSVVTALRKDYSQGIDLYCKPSNGYQQGALGAPYKNVCPEKVEDAFLAQYRKGKKVYITNMIESKNTELRTLDTQISDIDRRQSQLSKQMTILIAAQRITASNNPSPEQIEKDRSERQSLESSMSSERYKRNNLEKKAEALRAEIAQLRVELGAVDVESH